MPSCCCQRMSSASTLLALPYAMNPVHPSCNVRLITHPNPRALQQSESR